MGVVLRWNLPDGKEIRPLARHPNGWRIRAMPEPRPLYRLPEILAAPPDVPIVVVQSEKAADAGWRCGLLSTTSSGHAKAAYEEAYSVDVSADSIRCAVGEPRVWGNHPRLWT